MSKLGDRISAYGRYVTAPRQPVHSDPVGDEQSGHLGAEDDDTDTVAFFCPSRAAEFR